MQGCKVPLEVILLITGGKKCSIKLTVRKIRLLRVWENQSRKSPGGWVRQCLQLRRNQLGPEPFTKRGMPLKKTTKRKFQGKKTATCLLGECEHREQKEKYILHKGGGIWPNFLKGRNIIGKISNMANTVQKDSLDT